MTIGIECKNGVRPDLNTIRNGKPLKAELFVRRIPMDQVPQSEQGSAEFVHNLYREKDEIFDVYDKTGSFKSLGLPFQPLPYNYYDFYICISWIVFLSIPMFYGIFLLLKNATLLSSIAFFLVVLLCK